MKFTLIALMFAALSTAFAQDLQTKDPFIEVTGRAEIEVEPNEIYLLVRLKEFEEARQKTNLEQLDKDFQAAMKSASIDKSRILLADAGSNLRSITWRNKEAFRSKSYQIKLTSATELETVIEKLQVVTVDFVDITRLSHSDIEKINQDLKVKALQAAKSKADMLAKSIGSTIGKPLMVREWDDGGRPMDMEINMMSNARYQYQSTPAQPEPTAFRKIKLQAQVTAQFEIK